MSIPNNLLSWQSGFLTALYLALAFLVLLTFPAFFAAPVYPLDDTYIYMAMARNIAEHGIWGVTPYAFSGTSSSHLWVLILSIGHKLFGASEWIPLIFNLLFGTASICALALVANVLNFTSRQYFLFGIAYLLLVFPSQLSTIGMEPSLLAFLTLLFVWQVLKLLSTARSNSSSLMSTFIVTALFCGVRYESVYVVGPVVLMFCANRRFRDAAIILLGALTPIVGYGAFSIAHGGLFFPNTILLKGRVAFTDSWSAILNHQLDIGKNALAYTWLPAFLCLSCSLELASTPRLRIFRLIVVIGLIGSMLIGSLSNDPTSEILHAAARILSVLCLCAAVLSLWALFAKARRELTPALFVDIAALAMTAHLLTAQFGWLWRYETYLLCVAIMALAYVTTQHWEQITKIEWKRLKLTMSRVAIISSAMLLATGLVLRLFLCVTITPVFAAGVKYQHVEFAKFVRQYYPQSVVALNDIGAVCYYAKDVHLLDLWGLDSLDVTIARGKKKFDLPYVENIARERNADIAILQDYWWKSSTFFLKVPGIPESWIKAGEWKTPQYNGTDRVSFYAIKPRLTDKLQADLKNYPLPDVVQLLPKSEWK